MLSDCVYSLYSLQLLVTRVTHSYIKFKSHYRYIDTIHGAIITNGFATIATVMLSNAYQNKKFMKTFHSCTVCFAIDLTNLSLIHHGTKIPEKWPCTQLACVRVHPIRYLFSHCIHFPKYQNRILTGRYQLLCWISIAQRRYFITKKTQTQFII